jgi:hypothetical protein
MPSVIGAHHGSDDADSLAKYWTFYRAVAAAQLTRWLPRRRAVILDLSGPRARCAQQAACAGHEVIEVIDAHGAAEPGEHAEGLHRVIAEARTLGFLADGSVDAVIAENRVLSRHLVTESTVGEIARVLVPGGRLLLSVDSLMLGMAILAEQNHWAQLSDVPSAEVVLVPWPDGTISRCFWAEQLRELLVDAGFVVDWIRSRTALSPSVVDHVLSADPRALSRLVHTELTAPPGDESVGIHLVASARRSR